tara:strand:- start:61 stop:1383 length:1323 start_codon:yes stop_codon:yes gene_type:complete
MSPRPYTSSLTVRNTCPTIADQSPITLPKLVPVIQRFPTDTVSDIEAQMRAQLQQFSGLDLKGKRIAITAGSRGINGFISIVRSLVSQLKEKGAEPFIVPAMGSHGGATAEGQLAVLENLGITEESVNAPIRSSMDVVKLGEIEEETPVYCDRLAYESDGIIVCNRIKPHTAFAAEYESGLLKMMMIGLGKHIGTTEVHKLGFHRFHKALPDAAKIFLEKAPILFGIAIVDNAANQVARVKAIPADQILDQEKELLAYSKTLIGRILLSEIDVLVVDVMGKDISGAGMDSNVTGRSATNVQREYAPNIGQIVIRDLSKATKGNAIGMGNADIITSRAAEKIDLAVTYTNALTARTPVGAKIPLIASSDRQAIEIACRNATSGPDQTVRLIQISNTKDIEKIWVSTYYLPEIECREDIILDGEPRPIEFDESGNQTWPTIR